MAAPGSHTKPYLLKLCSIPGICSAIWDVHAGFYKGRIAKAVVAALDEEKGVMKLDDLEQHRSTVTRPIHTTYRGHTIYEVPPPTQARPFHWCAQIKLLLASSCVIFLSYRDWQVHHAIGCHSYSRERCEPSTTPGYCSERSWLSQ